MKVAAAQRDPKRGNDVELIRNLYLRRVKAGLHARPTPPLPSRNTVGSTMMRAEATVSEHTPGNPRAVCRQRGSVRLGGP